jgi:hypothetical protein
VEKRERIRRKREKREKKERKKERKSEKGRNEQQKDIKTTTKKSDVDLVIACHKGIMTVSEMQAQMRPLDARILRTRLLERIETKLNDKSNDKKE